MLCDMLYMSVSRWEQKLTESINSSLQGLYKNYINLNFVYKKVIVIKR